PASGERRRCAGWAGRRLRDADRPHARRGRGRLPATDCGVPLMAARPAVVGALLLALVAGCSGTSQRSPANAPSFERARPAAVADPAVTPGAAPGPDPSCDVGPSSLRPAPGNPASGPTIAAIKTRGRLIVGVDQNTYLFGYRDPASGQLVGF